MTSTRYSFFLLLLLSATIPGRSQNMSVEQIKAKYPGEQEVILNHSVSYKITIEKDSPVVQSEETQQIMYLSDQAGAYMSKYGFTHSSFHILQQYEAYTQTADNRKIKVSDFKTADSKSDGIFYDDVKETSFDFPAVAPGAVGTLRLNLLHKNPYLLSPFFFSYNVPVIHGELKIRFPKQMSVRYVLFGLNKDKIKVTQDSRRGETIYTFSTDNYPAERAYPDAPEPRWYGTHVVFFIEKYQDDKGQEHRFLGNVDDLYHLNHSYLATINKEVSPALHHIVDSLITGKTTQEAKARAIYNWVQQNIKYVAFEQGMEGFIPRDANLVCDRRFGDCKDMSSLLTLMLNTARVPAYYT
ncbi:MAG: DUF3857 domain-containing protein, partial [Bacteroidetes bacterium]|nr:DUF3857 domain-containing protein [Bacteroidota bacterium]